MTAVEWFWENIKNTEPTLDWYKLLEQSKEMQNQQSHEYAEFAIRCDRMDIKILNFEDYLKLEK